MKKIIYTFFICATAALMAQQPELVKDIYLGEGSSMYVYDDGVVSLGDKIIFAANDGIHGEELWISDGTEAGTYMLKDINPGIGPSYPRHFTLLNNKVYFTASDSLYVTDGTAAGTQKVKENLMVGGIGIGAYNDKLYFGGRTSPVGDIELWVSDGTSAGTHLFKEINPGGASGSIPRHFIVFNNKLYFTAYTVAEGRELWVTDGTPSGTYLFKDTNPGTAAWSDFRRFTVVGNKLYFYAKTEAHGFEPWVSDGTTAGTFMLKDINIGTHHSVENEFIEYNGKVYFNAGSTYALWVTDGTTEGTNWVNESGYMCSPEIVHNGKLLTSRKETGNAVTKLYSYDGTNFELLKDIIPYRESFTALNGKVYFRADDGISEQDYQLWITDGTTEGTVKIVPNYAITVNSITTNFFHPHHNTLFFLARYDLSIGRELYKLETVPLSVEDQVLGSAISIYPNPATHLLYVDVKESKSLQITVYNLLGQQVYYNVVADALTTINTSNWAADMYIVKIDIENRTETYKVIISR